MKIKVLLISIISLIFTYLFYLLYSHIGFNSNDIFDLFSYLLLILLYVIDFGVIYNYPKYNFNSNQFAKFNKKYMKILLVLFVVYSNFTMPLLVFHEILYLDVSVYLAIFSACSLDGCRY